MFEQNPDCGYSEVVSFQNLPQPLVTPNSATQDFTIVSTLDQSWLGTYKVSVQSRFMQPKIDGS